MIGEAIYALLAIACWLAFLTALLPGHWRGKDREGVIGAFSGLLAVFFTGAVVENMSHDPFSTYCTLVASIGFCAYYYRRAQKERSYNELLTARNEPAA